MFDSILYKYRVPAVAVAVLFSTYIAISLWVVVPQTDFSFYWRPDDQLVIRDVPSDSLAAPYMQPGDVVLAVDGREVHRSAAIYTNLGTAESYYYTVQRGDEIVTLDVPFTGSSTSIGISYRLPAVLLSAVFLITGGIVVYFVSPVDVVAVRVAYVFLVSGVAVIGLLGELVSVTGAWLTRPIWFFAHAGTVYLGFVPHLKPLSARLNRAFRWLLILAAMLGAAALLEAVFLFPQHLSLDRAIGIGIYEFALLASGISWLAALVTLIIRAHRMSSSYERQQVAILLFLIALAVLPVVTLTLVPRVLFDVVFLPFPLAIVLFVLVPAAFAFVIYRRGYLGIDIVASKFTAFLTTALISLAAYSAGLYALDHQFQFSRNFVLPATLLVLPVLMLTQYINQPVGDWVSNLFYGSVTTNRSLPEYATALRAKPELTTLGHIMRSVAKDIQINQALLALSDEDGSMRPVAQVNVEEWYQEEFQTFLEPILRSDARSRSVHPLFKEYEWLELLIPVIVRHEQIGFMGLSRPADGYFNAEQIQYLAQVADLVAVGSEAIMLFEVSRKISLQLLYAQESERKNLAAQIHDRPLQAITYVYHNLRHVLANSTSCQPEAAKILAAQGEELQAAMAELREICAGLYPPVIEHGLEMVLAEVCSHFEEKFGLTVVRTVELPNDVTSSPEIATAVYRVLTEALNNVVKHSQTQHAEVDLSFCNSHLTVTISDQGVGSSIPLLSIAELTRRQHMGIRGMSEWARLVNGTLSILDNQPQGTRIVLQIPLQ